MVADGEGSLGDVLSGCNRVRPNSVVDEQRGCEPFRWRLRLGGSPSWENILSSGLGELYVYSVVVRFPIIQARTGK